MQMMRGLLAGFGTLVGGALLTFPAAAQQYYYFETNEFVVYEGGGISGTLHRAVLAAQNNGCILFYTNVSGIARVNTASDVTGLVTSGACHQPDNPTVLAQFNSGSYTASFSLGVVNKGSVQPERGAVLYSGPDLGWGGTAGAEHELHPGSLGLP